MSLNRKVTVPEGSAPSDDGLFAPGDRSSTTSRPLPLSRTGSAVSRGKGSGIRPVVQWVDPAAGRGRRAPGAAGLARCSGLAPARRPDPERELRRLDRPVDGGTKISTHGVEVPLLPQPRCELV